MEAIASMLRAASRASLRGPGQKLNILAVPVHERYQSNLARTGHNFWFLRTRTVKDWNHAYARLPDNITLLPRDSLALPPDVRFDLVMAENKFGGYQLLAPIADRLHIPLLVLEHTLPPTGWPPAYLEQCRRMRGHRNYFISAFSREKWGWPADEARVIHHGVDTDVFRPGEATCCAGNILTVVNQYREPERLGCCGYEMAAEALRDLPWKHLGESKDGWSQPAKDIEDLVRHYRECAVFVDTANSSPIPSVLLEAMSCGAVCVSRGNAMVPEIIESGVNGFIRPDAEGMRALLVEILREPAAFRYAGEKARQTIKERFSLASFVREWDAALREAADVPWVGPIFTGDR